MCRMRKKTHRAHYISLIYKYITENMYIPKKTPSGYIFYTKKQRLKCAQFRSQGKRNREKIEENAQKTIKSAYFFNFFKKPIDKYILCGIICSLTNEKLFLED